MINKEALSKLIATQKIKTLEKHLFYCFIEKQNLNYKRSPILSTYFSDFTLNPSLYLKIEDFNITGLKQLEKYLELLIPKNDRKLNGAFFTPDYIVDFIIREINPKSNHKNLDPSCGCGAFLIGLVKFYNQNLRKNIRSVIRENIFGSDILLYNIKRSKLLLTILALQQNEIVKESDFNLYHQDSLKANWTLKFDNIVGNPPYVKFQDLDLKNRNYLSNNWETIQNGTYNLYFAFFELGHNILDNKGKLGYITPNNYFTSLAGKSIRNYFHFKKCISKIIDFRDKKVFDAQTYTAITFLDKNKNESISFDRIQNNQTPEEFLKNISFSVNNLKDLKVKKWRLLKTEEQENIKTIESIGTPIGELYNICVGIATLKDKVFFVNSVNSKKDYYIKETSEGEFQIEKDVTKSVYKISDFQTQQEIKNNKRKIIFPYIIKNGKATVIPEKDFQNRFPFCYEYLLSEKKRLQSRSKGKADFTPFYQWGRSQGLTRTGKRILNPTFSRKPRFLLVEEEDSYFTNGYGLFFKEQSNQSSLFKEYENPISKEKNIDVVQKILNSVIMDYYVRKTSVSIQGGYPCYQKNFIEKFTIPYFSKEEINLLRSLNSKEEIDNFLLHKYHLNLPVPNLAS